MAKNKAAQSLQKLSWEKQSKGLTKKQKSEKMRKVRLVALKK